MPDQGKQSRTYQLADMGTEHYDDAVISMLRLSLDALRLELS
ncbi:MAG TPA: hypothetical protein VK499_02505 [Propionibacteriaceae bacterium]|nr:hypothetical protein [Propionibacteriaceae bacterium]